MPRFAPVFGFPVVGLSVCFALAACGGKSGKTIEVRVAAPSAHRAMGAPERGADWRRIATDADRNRLRGWRDAWVTALAKARADGGGPAIAAEGALFDPDRALEGAMPPPGLYRCRVFKLGANGTAMRNFTAYPAVDCRIDDEGEVSSLYKIAGAQRPVGLIFPDGAARTVFLGTMVLGDETKPLDYGQDQNRDMAGYVERVGARRWRLVMPYPRFESLLDVVELVPVK